MEQRRNEGVWKTGDPRENPPTSPGTISTCENPGVTRPAVEPGSPWWEASSLPTLPPDPGIWRISFANTLDSTTFCVPEPLLVVRRLLLLPKTPAYLDERWHKGDSAACIKCAIAVKGKTLTWLAVFSSSRVYQWGLSAVTVDSLALAATALEATGLGQEAIDVTDENTAVHFAAAKAIATAAVPTLADATCRERVVAPAHVEEVGSEARYGIAEEISAEEGGNGSSTAACVTRILVALVGLLLAVAGPVVAAPADLVRNNLGEDVAIAEDTFVEGAIADDNSVEVAIADDISVEVAIADDISSGGAIADDISSGGAIAEDTSAEVAIADDISAEVAIADYISAEVAIADDISADVAIADDISADVAIADDISADVATVVEAAAAFPLAANGRFTLFVLAVGLVLVAVADASFRAAFIAVNAIAFLDFCTGATSALLGVPDERWDFVRAVARRLQFFLRTTVTALAFHRGEPPDFREWVSIVPDDAVDRRVFSGISRFPRPFISRRRSIFASTTPHRLSTPRRSEPPEHLHCSLELRFSAEAAIRHDAGLFIAFEAFTFHRFEWLTNIEVLRADEGEVRYGAAPECKGRGNGRSPRKPANQLHHLHDSHMVHLGYHVAARLRSRSEGAMRATVARTPSASSLLRARRAILSLLASYSGGILLCRRGRGGWVARPLASRLGEPDSIPIGVTPGFSHVEIVPDDAAGRWVFSAICLFPRPLHSGSAPYSPHFTLIGSQYLDVKSRPCLSTLPTSWIFNINCYHRSSCVLRDTDVSDAARWVVSCSPVCGATSGVFARRWYSMDMDCLRRAVAEMLAPTIPTHMAIRHHPGAKTTCKHVLIPVTRQQGGAEMISDIIQVRKRPGSTCRRQLPRRYIPALDSYKVNWSSVKNEGFVMSLNLAMFTLKSEQFKTAPKQRTACMYVETISLESASELVSEEIWAVLNREVLRADEGEARRVLSSGIPRHESRMRKSGGDPTGDRTRIHVDDSISMVAAATKRDRHGPSHKRLLTRDGHTYNPLTLTAAAHLGPVKHLRSRPTTVQLLLGLTWFAASTPRADDLYAVHGRVSETASGSIPGRVPGFLGDLLFPQPFLSGATPFSPQLPSSALKTSLLRATQISSFTHEIREFNDLQASLYSLVYKHDDITCTLVVCCHSERRRLGQRSPGCRRVIDGKTARQSSALRVEAMRRLMRMSRSPLALTRFQASRAELLRPGGH
ncbi:hypothetical protein PR048_024542, partial [Dryococelus australis]